MDKLTLCLSALALLAILTAATGIPVQRELKRRRAKQFRVICENWLKDINLIAADHPSCNTGGSDLFSASGKIDERECSGGWIIRYPLIKRYPNLGLTARIDLLIHVYSLVPDANGGIDTIFVDLAESAPRWWDSQYRMSAFPKITSLIYATKGRERKFAYTSAFSNTLTPAH